MTHLFIAVAKFQRFRYQVFRYQFILPQNVSTFAWMNKTISFGSETHTFTEIWKKKSAKSNQKAIRKRNTWSQVLWAWNTCHEPRYFMPYILSTCGLETLAVKPGVSLPNILLFVFVDFFFQISVKICVLLPNYKVLFKFARKSRHFGGQLHWSRNRWNLATAV